MIDAALYALWQRPLPSLSDDELRAAMPAPAPTNSVLHEIRRAIAREATRRGIQLVRRSDAPSKRTEPG